MGPSTRPPAPSRRPPAPTRSSRAPRDRSQWAALAVALTGLGGADDLGVLGRRAGGRLVLGPRAALAVALDLVALLGHLARPQRAAGQVHGQAEHGHHDGDHQEQEKCDSTFHAVDATRAPGMGNRPACRLKARWSPSPGRRPGSGAPRCASWRAAVPTWG